MEKGTTQEKPPHSDSIYPKSAAWTTMMVDYSFRLILPVIQGI